LDLMLNEIYILIVAFLVILALVLWFINWRLKQINKEGQVDEKLLRVIETLQKGTSDLQKGLQDQSRHISDTLQSSTKTLNERLDNAARYISQVAKEVGQMSEIGRSMKDLQEFLKSPKLRGNIGEEVLKDLISQMFPKNSFYLQYGFKSGEKVDAALRTEAGLLPIDSKFPMENFQRMVKAQTEEERNKIRKTFIADVKKHLKNVAGKYILPGEGTMDFALMYIPSESVYYEIVNLPELTEFARQLRVYPVSPTTLYASLRMILLSFEGKKIEVRSRQVFQLLRAIQRDYQKTEGVLSVLGKHISNTYNQMAKVTQAFSLLGQKLTSTQTLEAGEEKTDETGDIKQDSSLHQQA